MVGKISIKYKLLALLLIIPAICLLLYLFMAKSIFEKDKIAYVFSSGLQQIKTVKLQFKMELKNIKQTEKIVLSGIDLDGQTMDDLSHKLIEERQNILLFELYKVDQNDGPFNIIKKANQKLPITRNLEKKYPVFKKVIFKQLEQKEEIVKIVDPENSTILYAHKMSHESSQGVYYSIFLFKSEDLFSLFSTKELFKNFIVDQNGRILLGLSTIWKNQLNSFTNFSFFQTIVTNKFPMGTLETDSKDGKQQLVSYVKFDEGKYIALSFLDKKFALQATSILLSKSIIFLIFLLALTVIISLLASKKMTQALRQLYHAAIKIEEGDFETQVEVKSNDEVGELGHAFNIMIQKISNLLSELKEYNEKLEIMVHERTAELNEAMQTQKAMIDGLNQGLIIFGRDRKVLPVYSKPSEVIFETEPTNKLIEDLLNLTGENRDAFCELCQNLFSEDLLPFKDLIEMAPKSMANSQNRQIFLNYSPIRDNRNKISGIVTIATDRTDELLAIKRAEDERKYVQMVIKVLSDKYQFIKFLQNSFSELAEMYNTMTSDEVVENKKLILLSKAHTLKGTSSMFHLNEISDSFHKLEDIINKLDNDPPPIKEETINKIEEIEQKLTQLVSENEKILGLEAWEKADEKYEISKNIITGYYDLLLQKKSHTLLAKNYYNCFYTKPIASFFTHYNDVVQNLAKTRGKKVDDIQLVHNQIRIIEEPYRSMLESLIHIFRNIVDHGIEKEEERIKANKEPAGKIGVAITEELTEEKDTIIIEITDDGKGIDHIQVKQKAIEKGLTSKEEAENMATEEIVKFIFKEEFSTQSAVSKLSGRGVGLHVVQKEIEKMDGTIEVESKPNEGTKFKIKFPRIDKNDTLNINHH